MNKRVTVSIDLSEEAARAVEAAVASGEFADAREAVEAAVEDWAAMANDAAEIRPEDVERFRKAWDEGIASGPGRFVSIDDLIADARSKLRRQGAA